MGRFVSASWPLTVLSYNLGERKGRILVKKVLRDILGETAYKRWLLEPHEKELKLLMKKQRRIEFKRLKPSMGMIRVEK